MPDTAPDTAETAPMGIKGPRIQGKQPRFFKLQTQLLDDGRHTQPLAETESLWTWMRVYASGGENTLHMHKYEDHFFLILDGSAIFYGPNGEQKKLGRNEGIMLPAGTYYWFHSSGDVPLVMLRCGAQAGDGSVKERIGIDGKFLHGESKENKYRPPVYRDGSQYE
jgi:mannose-6-phosphate isomerase-like protein (cupin superfamily)